MTEKQQQSVCTEVSLTKKQLEGEPVKGNDEVNLKEEQLKKMNQSVL